jgi:predicted transcriptional regulator
MGRWHRHDSRRPTVTLKLEAELITAIDQHATAQRTTRSAWLRGAIDNALAHPTHITPR